MTKTIIYTRGGDCYRGESDLSNRELKELKLQQRESGSIGYMIGRAHWNQERVIVFFDQEPTNIEFEEFRRRKNGFIGAKWRNLK